MYWLLFVMLSAILMGTSEQTTRPQGHWECQKDNGTEITSCDFNNGFCALEHGIVFPGEVEWLLKSYNQVNGIKNNFNFPTNGRFMSLDNKNVNVSIGDNGTIEFYMKTPNHNIVYVCIDLIYATKSYEPTPLKQNAAFKDSPNFHVKWTKSCKANLFGNCEKLLFGNSVITEDTDFVWKNGHFESHVSDLDSLVFLSMLTPDRASINIDNIRIRHGVWVPDPVTTTTQSMTTETTATTRTTTQKATLPTTILTTTTTTTPKTTTTTTTPKSTSTTPKTTSNTPKTTTTTTPKTTTPKTTTTTPKTTTTTTPKKTSTTPKTTTTTTPTTTKIDTDNQLKPSQTSLSPQSSVSNTPTSSQSGTLSTISLAESTSTAFTGTVITPSLKISPTVTEKTTVPCTGFSISDETSKSAFSCIATVTVSVCPSQTTSVVTNTPEYFSSSIIPNGVTKTKHSTTTTVASTTTPKPRQPTTTKTTTTTTNPTTETTTTNPTTETTTTNPTTETTTTRKLTSPTSEFKTTHKTKFTTLMTRRQSYATRKYVTSRPRTTSPSNDRSPPVNGMNNSKPTNCSSFPCLSSTPPFGTGQDDGNIFHTFWTMSELTKLILVACIGGLGWILFFVCLILIACGRREKTDDDVRKKPITNVVSPLNERKQMPEINSW